MAVFLPNRKLWRSEIAIALHRATDGQCLPEQFETRLDVKPQSVATQWIDAASRLPDMPFRRNSSPQETEWSFSRNLGTGWEVLLITAYCSIAETGTSPRRTPSLTLF